ncbi:DUF975 family protein [Butyrivibrio sp. MC2013]|uniref:DUF975 family protein n=1 Tax=Butyrivibrio sp. MC2013 TaxID=1280686 RepID=UPI00041BCE06|nr:DUF975 family protein [Butyrivibrio sp. MC2013]
MWTIKEVKSRGKAAFKANYLNSVIAGILAVLFAGTAVAGGGRSASSAASAGESLLSEMTVDQLMIVAAAVVGAMTVAYAISLVLKIFIYNPIKVGCASFFKKNVENPGQKLDVILEGFSDYGRVFITLFLKDLFIFFWSLLFVIPGLVKSYSYRMVPYILKDEPELSATEVITRSRQMMNGNKGKAFLFDLSFIGWIILSAITLDIVGILWTTPYMENANAALYLELKNNRG